MPSHFVRFSAAREVNSGLIHRLYCCVCTVVLLTGCVSDRNAQQTTAATPEVAGQAVEQTLAAAELAQHEGRYPQAAQAYVQAAMASTDEQLIESAARACYDTQQLQAAAQIVARWLQLNPSNDAARELAAMTVLKLYRVDTASAELQQLLNSAYITPAAGFIDLLPKLESADSNAATAVAKLLVERFPDSAEAHYVLAQLAGQTANWALMLSAAERAHTLAHFWSPAGLLLARAQLASGNVELALQTAREVVKEDDSGATRSEYASLLLATNHGNDALRLWRELEEQDGDNSAAIRALAQLDFELGNYQSAFTRFNRLLNTGKHLSESIFYLGNIAERTGAKGEARQLYDRVQEGEFAAAAQLRIAHLIKDSAGLTAALSFLQTYGEANPDGLLLSLKARAEMLSESGDEPAALAVYDAAVAKYPDVAELQLSRAFQLVKMGKTRAALQAMQQLVSARPQDPTALNALGYTLVDQGHQYQAGHDYIATALSYSPDSGAVLDSMGWALFKLGRKQEALEYLQRAGKRLADSDLDLHLGDVLWALDRRDEALRAWQAGLERAPDNKSLLQRVKRAKSTH